MINKNSPQVEGFLKQKNEKCSYHFPLNGFFLQAGNNKLSKLYV